MYHMHIVVSLSGNRSGKYGQSLCLCNSCLNNEYLML